MQTVKVDVVNLSTNELPKYADLGSSGVDLRADITKINPKFLFNATWDDDKVIIYPGGRALIPTGLHTAFSNEYELQIRARSGLALKHGILLVNGLGTLDASYRGDCGVILANIGSEPFEIKQGDRIAQAVLMEVKKIQWNELSNLEELEDSERGEDGFGSSGIK